MTKRLFIFAGYDKKNAINNATAFYVKKLSELGDVIVTIDNNILSSELKKIKPYTIFTKAIRHFEYDFGSYKRGFSYAIEKNILFDYDFVYFVNDSVYGPLSDIKIFLRKFEVTGKDGFGFVCKQNTELMYLQSWFLGVSKKVCKNENFQNFILNIKVPMGHIPYDLEKRWTKILVENNFEFTYSFVAHGHDIYNRPKKLFNESLPFFKKAIVKRKNAGYGNQIKYILSKIDKKLSNLIIKDIERLYGKKYLQKLLTSNPIKIFYRKTKYGISKILKGEKI